MSSTLSLAGRAPALVRHGRRVAVSAPLAKRPLTIGAANGFLQAQKRALNEQFAQKRAFTRSAVRASSSATQAAPDPKSYIDSGVIKPQEITGLKKVLVIGSGGLAIGQAGEFDYSGMLLC